MALNAFDAPLNAGNVRPSMWGGMTGNEPSVSPTGAPVANGQGPGFGVSTSASVTANAQGVQVASSFGLSGLVTFALVMGALYVADKYLTE